MTPSDYGCKDYDINRMCRYDRRGIDKNFDGCQRKTDQAYLESNGLWVHGISHQKDEEYHAAVV